MSGIHERNLRVICADLPAPPLFWKDKSGTRLGFETAVINALAQTLGRTPILVYENWANFYPALESGHGDMVLCGQGISEQRKLLANFTEPYAVFDESVMVLKTSNIKSAADLVGKKVGAIANSLNMALAETFSGVVCVPFGGDTDDILGDMVSALKRGEIDALVDDDVALVPLTSDEQFEISFVVPTRNKWGIAVQRDNLELLNSLNLAVMEIKRNGDLESIWRKFMPTLSYPFLANDSVIK